MEGGASGNRRTFQKIKIPHRIFLIISRGTMLASDEYGGKRELGIGILLGTGDEKIKGLSYRKQEVFETRAALGDCDRCKE